MRWKGGGYVWKLNSHSKSALSAPIILLKLESNENIPKHEHGYWVEGKEYFHTSVWNARSFLRWLVGAKTPTFSGWQALFSSRKKAFENAHNACKCLKMLTIAYKCSALLVVNGKMGSRRLDPNMRHIMTFLLLLRFQNQLWRRRD